MVIDIFKAIIWLITFKWFPVFWCFMFHSSEDIETFRSDDPLEVNVKCKKCNRVWTVDICPY